MDNAAIPAAQRRQSGRKRKAVSYCELAEDVESDKEVYVKEEEDDTHGERPKKKAKKTTKREPKLKKHQIFDFLALPPELRNKIYNLALVPEEGLAFASATRKNRRCVARGMLREHDVKGPDPRARWRRRRHRDSYIRLGGSIRGKLTPLSPSILALNKQIRAEASAMLYSQDLYFLDMTALHTFLTMLGPSQKELLTSITVYDWGRAEFKKAMNHAALSLLAGATNLEVLYINCKVASNYYGTYHDQRNGARLAMKIYRDAHFWLETVGAATGDWAAAAELIAIADDNFDTYSGSSPTEKVLETREQAFLTHLENMLKRG